MKNPWIQERKESERKLIIRNLCFHVTWTNNYNTLSPMVQSLMKPVMMILEKMTPAIRVHLLGNESRGNLRNGGEKILGGGSE